MTWEREFWTTPSRDTTVLCSLTDRLVLGSLTPWWDTVPTSKLFPVYIRSKRSANVKTFRGIVPITCDELFKAIEANADSTKTFQVTFSMLEIYNEQVRDLLVKNNPKGGLNVRQHPSLGFYVDNLKKVPVGSYQEIESRMDEGMSLHTTRVSEESLRNPSTELDNGPFQIWTCEISGAQSR